MDDHRILLFHYKFAAAAFAHGKYEIALERLHPILHQGDKILRKDMEINARLLELLCLYESKAFDRMSYRLISFGRSVVKTKKATTLQLDTHKMLRALLQTYPEDNQTFLQQQLSSFREKAAQPRERMFLKYLNVIEWMESGSKA